MNDAGKAITAFVAMPGTRQIAQPNINTDRAAPNCKINLLLNSLFL